MIMMDAPNVNSSASITDETLVRSRGQSNAFNFTFIAGTPQDRYLIRRNAMQSVWRHRKVQAGRNSAQIPNIKRRELRSKNGTRAQSKDKNPGGSGAHGSNVDAEMQNESFSAGPASKPFITAKEATVFGNRVERRNHYGEEEGSSEVDVEVKGARSVRDEPTATPSPCSVGPVNTDPFGTLPITVLRRDRHLLQHWFQVFPRIMYGPLQPIGEGSFLNLWTPNDVSNPGSFHGTLAYAATHFGEMTGRDMSDRTAFHKMRAIQFINHWLPDPAHATSDAAIATVLRLLTIEDWWGTRTAKIIHQAGLERMIALRGGWSTFVSNWRLISCILHFLLAAKPTWYYVPPQPIPFLLQHPPEEQTLHLTHSNVNSRKFKLLCKLFASFLRELEGLIRLPSARPSFSHLSRLTGVKRAILALQHFSRFPAGKVEAKDIHSCIEESCRVPAIIFIATLVRDYIRLPLLYGPAIRRLDAGLAASEKMWTGSIQVLFVLIIQGGGKYRGVEDLERALYVLKLMQPAKQLSWTSWKRMKESVLDILTRLMGEDTQRTDIAIPVEMFDADLLLTEILEAHQYPTPAAAERQDST